MDSLHSKFVELMEGHKGKVLDAGAGLGDLSSILSDTGFDVTSCDIEPEDFKQGKCERVDLNQRLPYKSSQFDYVVCAEVSEHIENPHHLLREFNRVLKKGGLLLISTPNITNVFSRIKFLFTGKFFCFSDEERRLGHLNPIPWWEMDDALAMHGFKLEQRTSNAYLMLCGCGGARNAAKRLFVRLAYLVLYTFIRPKNKELLKGDSLIFVARKVHVL